MAKVTVSSAAETDYTHALCWYADHSREIALQFESEIEEALEGIAATPARYPQCDDRHQFYLMKRFPFQIIYRTSVDTVTIIAIAHTSRAPGYWRGR